MSYITFFTFVFCDMATTTKNDIVEIKDGVVRVRLNHGLYALFDDTPEIVELLRRYKICPRQNNGRWHLLTNIAGGRNGVHVPQLIMDCPKGMQVDHLNGDNLDNRKCNLRIVPFGTHRADKLKVYKNSKTGITGLSEYDTYWLVTKMPPGETKKSRVFSFAVHGGKEAAKAAALELLGKTTSI